MHYEVVRLSSKGQLVVPRDVRNILGLRPGSKFALVTDGHDVLLKPLAEQDASALKRLADAARRLLEVARTDSQRRKTGD